MAHAKSTQVKRAIQQYVARNRNRWIYLQDELFPVVKEAIPDIERRQTVVERAAEMAGGRPSYKGDALLGWFYRVEREGRRRAAIMAISVPEAALIGGTPPQGERPYQRSPRRKANPQESLYNRVVRTPELRMAFLGAQDGCCAGCGRRYDHWRCLELDHVVSIDANNDVPANLQLICPPCNNWKANDLTTEQLWQKNSTEGFMFEQAAAERAHRSALAYGNQLMETL